MPVPAHRKHAPHTLQGQLVRCADTGITQSKGTSAAAVASQANRHYKCLHLQKTAFRPMKDGLSLCKTRSFDV